MGTGGELKIIEQAMKQKWNIPPAAFTEIPKKLFAIAKDGSNRDQVTAARLLKSMNDANADHEPPLLKAPQVHLHADVTGNINGNTDDRRLTLIERIRSLIVDDRGTGSDRVVIEQPAATAGGQTDSPPQSPTPKQRKAKSTRKRNRRDSTGK